MIVADIEDESLIGYGILAEDEYGPADLPVKCDRLKGYTLSPEGETIENKTFTGADSICIPGRSEVLVDVFIERVVTEDEFDRQSDYIVESSEVFKDNYQIVNVGR